MKKVVIFLAVLALAAPVFAQAEPNVYITCSDNADGTSTISYDATDAGVVRAFSMDLTVDGGAKITAINGYDAEGAGAGTTVPVGYSIYMSSIDFGTDPNNVDAWGDPVASGVDALGGLTTAGITVEMGSLYDMDAATPDTPPLTGDLFTITVDLACNLTIEDTVQKGTRGGIVLETGLGANLVSSGCSLTIDGGCFVGNPTETANWIAWGEPGNWCGDCWRTGDINGDCAITFSGDVMVVFADLKAPTSPLALTGRSDFNMDGAITFSGDVMPVFQALKAGTLCPIPCTPLP